MNERSNTVLGEWPYVLFFAALGLPSGNFWFILGNAFIWYAVAYIGRRFL